MRVPVAAGLLARLVCVPIAAHADTSDRLSKTVPLPPGRAIRIEATVADLSIVGSDRTDLAVEIVRRAPSAGDLAKYPVVIDDNPSALRIAVSQAEAGRDPALRTDIAIAAPVTAVFEAIRVFEGHVRLTNIKGVCDVDLRRGAIDAAGIGGRVRLEAGIGSVEVRQAELTSGGMMRLRVFNGPLRVRFCVGRFARFFRRVAHGRILAISPGIPLFRRRLILWRPATPCSQCPLPTGRNHQQRQ